MIEYRVYTPDQNSDYEYVAHATFDSALEMARRREIVYCDSQIIRVYEDGKHIHTYSVINQHPISF